MTCMGLRVPPGFALSLKTCSDFMSLSGAENEIRAFLEAGHDLDDIEVLNKVSAELRSIVESKEIPAEMRDAILSCYEELCTRCNISDVAVSTRSAGAKSHPGQYETHLNVKGKPDVLKNIKKVWSSAFNPRSIAARKRAGLPLHSDPIGVGVLKMVNARAAGVLFTADPNTGDRSKMIIEANWGLGESVVGGGAVPDVFIVKKDNLEIIEKRLGDKGRCIRCTFDGVVEQETPIEQKCAFCLKDVEVMEIGRLGKILEDCFGVPQDCEWAVDDDLTYPDSVILLQTRAAVIAQKADPVNQVINMMLGYFGS
jgi:pyruvate,water dikinase